MHKIEILVKGDALKAHALYELIMLMLSSTFFQKIHGVEIPAASFIPVREEVEVDNG